MGKRQVAYKLVQIDKIEEFALPAPEWHEDMSGYVEWRLHEVVLVGAGVPFAVLVKYEVNPNE